MTCLSSLHLPWQDTRYPVRALGKEESQALLGKHLPGHQVLVTLIVDLGWLSGQAGEQISLAWNSGKGSLPRALSWSAPWAGLASQAEKERQACPEGACSVMVVVFAPSSVSVWFFWTMYTPVIQDTLQYVFGRGIIFLRWGLAM